MQAISQLKEQGQQAFDRKDYAAALAAFREILIDHPDFADIQHAAALCLIFMGRSADALEALDAALSANPDYVEAHVNRALVLQDLGRYDDARAAFNRAGELEHDDGGRFPAALASRLAAGHAALGETYVDAGALDEGAAQYRTALELRPGFHDIRNRLAEVLMAQGRPAEAEQELRRVLETNPRFTAARLNLGLALYRQGLRRDAASEWEQCRSEQPDNPQLRAYLSTLERPDGDAETLA